MSRRWVWMVLVSVLWMSPVFAQERQERSVPEQLDMARVLLERTSQDYERCKVDYADLWVQARKLTVTHQQVQQELQKMKEAAPKEAVAPSEPLPSGAKPE